MAQYRGQTIYITYILTKYLYIRFIKLIRVWVIVNDKNWQREQKLNKKKT